MAPGRHLQSPRAARGVPAAMIHYRIEVADAAAHQFKVTLTIADPAPVQQLSLPVWIPGSYM
ncbi:MAG: hypothetical protein ACJ8IK_30440, partial [Burkholderiaceae bacterium]